MAKWPDTSKAGRPRRNRKVPAAGNDARAADTRAAALDRRPVLGAFFVAAIPVLCLLPFVDKPFNVDDPLFVWSGRHIVDHPADFFGFQSNWKGFEEPMYKINQNPPAVSYLIAPAIAVFGEREIPVHLALLLPVIASVLGTYALARHLCSRPVLAALCAALTPAFLISGSSAMCDMTMLAFYVWAIVLWVRGIKGGSAWMPALSGVLIVGAALTKYFGITCILLLAAYTLFERRRPGLWLLAFLIPAVAVAAYEWYTSILYGIGLIHDAVSFGISVAKVPRAHLSVPAKLCLGLTFSGGCWLVVLCFAPILWSWRAWLGVVVAAVIVVTVVIAADLGRPMWQFRANGLSATRLVHWVLFVMGGLFLFWMSISDLYRCRDPGALLLFLWIAGVFLFSTLVNWSVNGRTLLPMAPAVGILLVRRLDLRKDRLSKSGMWLVAWPLAPAACIALSALWGDYAWAQAVRQGAAALENDLRAVPGTTYFMGHWGFQYYMEQAGAKPVDLRESRVYPGDAVAFTENNSNNGRVPQVMNRVLSSHEIPASRWIATMNPKTGAAFYSDYYGQLPFAFGPTPPEKYITFVHGQTGK